MTRTTLVTWMALVLTVKGPGPLAHATPPTAEPTAARAEALYKARRFLEAARAFEALAPRHVKYLYYAGLACEAIGHDGQAIAHWRRVAEAPEVEPGLRTRARARAERAETRTTRLLLSVTPATAAPGSTVELSYQGGGERQKRVMKLEALAGGIHLEGGTWKIEVRSADPEYAPGSQQVTLSVRHAEKTVEIELAPEQAEGELLVARGGNNKFSIPLERRSGVMKTRPLAIGAGVSSVVFAAGGTLGLAFSETKLSALSTTGVVDAESAKDHLDVIHVGSLAAGASVGFFVTAVTAAIKRDQTRRRAWIAEAGLGGLLGAGGGLWAGLALRWWIPRLNHDDPNEGRKTLSAYEMNRYRNNFYPSMIMIGTGAALLVGSITGLALERRPARKRGGHAKARLRMVFPLTVDF